MSDRRPLGLEYSLLGTLMAALIAEPPYTDAPLLRHRGPVHGFRSALTKPEQRVRKAKNKAARAARRITRRNG